MPPSRWCWGRKGPGSETLTERRHECEIDRIADKIAYAAQRVAAEFIEDIDGDLTVRIGGGGDAPADGDALHHLAERIFIPLTSAGTVICFFVEWKVALSWVKM